MSYFSTPSTYSHNRSINPDERQMYPSDLQNYKSVQSIKGNYLNPAKPHLTVNNPNIGASWGAARNVHEVHMYNPSIQQNGQVFYDPRVGINGNRTAKSDSGRMIYVEPSSKYATNQTPSRFMASKENGPYSLGLGPMMNTQTQMLPDYTETNSEMSKKKVDEYFINNNVQQTQEYTTEGHKSIKLPSGRVIEFDVKPPEIGSCPKPSSDVQRIQNTKYKTESNLHSFNTILTDEYSRSTKNLPTVQNQPQENFEGWSSGLSNIQEKSMYNQSIYAKKYFEKVEDSEQIKDVKDVKGVKESFSFGSKSDDVGDILYGQMFKTYSKAISDWLLSFKPYVKWMDNWKILKRNLEKTDLNITNLPSDDKEIAYTLNKGEVIKFRWKDNKSFISKNIFIYVLLHELTHEVFPPSFQGHDDPFPQMLCLLCVAATELDLIQVDKIPNDVYMSNGRPITSKNSIIDEICYGCDMLIEANKHIPKYVEYYKNKKIMINKKR